MPQHVLRTMLADLSWPVNNGDCLQAITYDEGAVHRFQYLLEPSLRAAGIVVSSWEPWVTWTRKVQPTAWHFDKALGRSRHKLYVYLNDAPGTIFDRKRQFHVEGNAGTLVLFPIDIEHRGAPNQQHILKQLVGLRPVL